MLSADLMTAFIFFEILSFTSFTWVIHEENEAAIRAAKTYLAIAVIGGLLLYGTSAALACGPGREFSELKASAAGASDQRRFCSRSPDSLWVRGEGRHVSAAHLASEGASGRAGSGIGAAFRHPHKVGVYGILMTTTQAFAGNTVYGILVLVLGTVTMALGALLAVFSVNLKGRLPARPCRRSALS